MSEYRNIYLVRHGETTSNLTQTWRTANEQLTETGLKQAHAVGNRLANLSLKGLITSTSARTMKTAEIIAEHTGHVVEGDPLFYEEKSPTSIQGLVHKKSPDNLIEQYLTALVENSENPNHRFEDEENLYERRKRIQYIYAYIKAAEDGLLIVTNGNILKMLASYIVLGEDCTVKDLYLGSLRFRTSNTGITHLLVNDEEVRILTWNDFAHLLD